MAFSSGLQLITVNVTMNSGVIGYELLLHSPRHVSSAFYAAFGGGFGAGGAGVRADAFAAGECGGAEAESQVVHSAVDGGRAADD